MARMRDSHSTQLSFFAKGAAFSRLFKGASSLLPEEDKQLVAVSCAGRAHGASKTCLKIEAKRGISQFIVKCSDGQTL